MSTGRHLFSAAVLTAGITALALVPQFEGVGPTAVIGGETYAIAYADPAHGWAVPTICHGRTRGVFRGQRATLDECQEWLREDLTVEGRVLAQVVRQPITQRQYDAMLSWAYNVGAGNVRASVLVRKVNAGDCRGAAREFNESPQIGPDGKPRIYRGRTLRHPENRAVLLKSGNPIMKWTTAGGEPMLGLIVRRGTERSHFESDCDTWGRE